MHKCSCFHVAKPLSHSFRLIVDHTPLTDALFYSIDLSEPNSKRQSYLHLAAINCLSTLQPIAGSKVPPTIVKDNQ